jgi:hypothetical protein
MARRFPAAVCRPVIHLSSLIAPCGATTLIEPYNGIGMNGSLKSRTNPFRLLRCQPSQADRSLVSQVRDSQNWAVVRGEHACLRRLTDCIIYKPHCRAIGCVSPSRRLQRVSSVRIACGAGCSLMVLVPIFVDRQTLRASSMVLTSSRQKDQMSCRKYYNIAGSRICSRNDRNRRGGVMKSCGKRKEFEYGDGPFIFVLPLIVVLCFLCLDFD